MLWAMERLLVLEGVRVHYRRGSLALPVLANVSLEVMAGEVVAVLAMRGQGKSTLLRVAAGMQRPAEGRVLLDGRELWGLDEVSRQRLLCGVVGWVEAAPPAVDVPVLEHVLMPLLVGRGRRGALVGARAALERVGVSGCAPRRWGELSDRERALVAVACAIVRAPRLLVVDDLTCTLGLEDTDEVTGLLRELSREMGVGVLMGVSDAGATQWSDRLMTLAGRELLAVLGPDGGEGGEVVQFPGGLEGVGEAG